MSTESVKHKKSNGRDLQLPAAPTIDLFEPTRTWAAPEMAPLTITIPAEVPETAAVSSDSEVTVVAVPPAPPLVLDHILDFNTRGDTRRP